MGDTLNEIEARARECSAIANGAQGGGARASSGPWLRSTVAMLARDSLALVGRVRELETLAASLRSALLIAACDPDGACEIECANGCVRLAAVDEFSRAGSVGASKAASGEERE